MASLLAVPTIVVHGFILKHEPENHTGAKKSLWNFPGIHGGNLKRALAYCDNPNMGDNPNMENDPGLKIRDGYIVYAVLAIEAAVNGPSVKLHKGEVWCAHQPHVVGILVWTRPDHVWELPKFADPALQTLANLDRCDFLDKLQSSQAIRDVPQYSPWTTWQKIKHKTKK